jgi:hypothetical protein
MCLVFFLVYCLMSLMLLTIFLGGSGILLFLLVILFYVGFPPFPSFLAKIIVIRKVSGFSLFAVLLLIVGMVLLVGVM